MSDEKQGTKPGDKPQDPQKGTKTEQGAKPADAKATETKSAEPKAAKEAPPKKIKVTTFSIVGEVSDNTKCPPQAKVVVEAVKQAMAKHGRAKVSREEIVELLKDPNKLQTVQDPARIFGFYKPRLMEMGVLTQHVEEKTVKVEAAVADQKAGKAGKTEPPKAEKAAS